MKLSTKIVVLTVFSGLFALLLLMGSTHSALAASTTTATPKAVATTRHEPPSSYPAGTTTAPPKAVATTRGEPPLGRSPDYRFPGKYYLPRDYSIADLIPWSSYNPAAVPWNPYHPDVVTGPYFGPASSYEPGGYGVLWRHNPAYWHSIANDILRLYPIQELP